MHDLLAKRTQTHFSELVFPCDDVVGDTGKTEEDGDDDAGAVPPEAAVQDDRIGGFVAEVAEDGAQGGAGVGEDFAVGVCEAVLLAWLV